MAQNKKNYTYAIGRRKSAVTTVKLFKGKGESIVNQITLIKYFPTKLDQLSYEKPFVITKTLDKYHFEAKIIGGGSTGQVQALALAISRALVKIDASFKSDLRAVGLLTVDSRIKQRRMVGTGGKSRRQKQSPKR
ncbi:MAG: 30S ribosomal protein S9 [Candidatus Shapirobacteria bacterium]|nr:30S ribosomal protein S9 [Candidatus Shapirobacteria bacterium]